MPLPASGFGPYVVKRIPILQVIMQEKLQERLSPMPSKTVEAAPIPADTGSPPARDLSPAAQRALAEAASRRAEIDARAAALAKDREINGRGGLEPVRYDDWEVKGIASDF